MKGFHVRRGAHWIVISLFLVVAGCGGDSGTNSGNTGNTGNTGGTGGTGAGSFEITTDVTVGNDFFSPANIQVSPGATVTWTWAGGRDHNVTFTVASISSPTQSSGTHVAAMPLTTGLDYIYLCLIHPATMQGSVRVQ